MQKSKKLKKVIVALIIIAVVGAGGYFGFQAWSQNRLTAVVSMSDPVPIQPAGTQDISEVVSASGTVNLRKEESVYAAATQRISEVLVEVGDIVKKGQVIVLYDIEDRRAQLEKQIRQTEININTQNLTLRSMTTPASASTINQLQASIDSADKALFDAQSSVTSTELKISDQHDAILRAEESYANAQDSIDKADRSIQRAYEEIDKAEKKVTDAEEELAKQKQLLDVDGISQEEYKKYEDAVVTARDGVKQAQDTLENAMDAKKQAEDSKKQAGYSVENAQNTLRDLNHTLESSQNNVSSAQKTLTNAQKNLEDAKVVLKDEGDRINYEKQENQIKLLEIDLADYKKQLAELTENDVSPMDGTITGVSAAKGKSVDTSTILVTLADFNDLIVTSNISEYDVPKLEINQPVLMTSDGMDNVEFKGRITKIADTAVSRSAASGTETVVPVEVTFDEQTSMLKPGFNLDLEITVAHSPKAVTVPITAIQRDNFNTGYFVFIVGDDRTLKKTPVITGIISDMVVEIVSGVSEGDRVIESPADFMQDGMTMDELAALSNKNANRFRIFGGGNQPGMNMGGGVRIQQGAGAQRQPAGGQSGNTVFVRP